MARIQRPLNQAACAEADDAIYANHANDPRPNPLYSADGTRLPLDATSPGQEALREEWRQLYLAALDKQNQPAAGGGGTDAPPPANPPAEVDPPERDVGHPEQGCPKKHRFTLKLAPLPDGKDRSAYSWWPARPPGYASAKYSAEITDGHHSGSLDGDGAVKFEGIPAGSCRIEFAAFYDDVKTALTPT